MGVSDDASKACAMLITTWWHVTSEGVATLLFLDFCGRMLTLEGRVMARVSVADAHHSLVVCHQTVVAGLTSG